MIIEEFSKLERFPPHRHFVISWRRNIPFMHVFCVELGFSLLRPQKKRKKSRVENGVYNILLFVSSQQIHL